MSWDDTLGVGVRVGNSRLFILIVLCAFAVCTITRDASGVSPESQQVRKNNRWKPVAVLEMRTQPLPPPGLSGQHPHLTRGVVWMQGGKIVATPNKVGLVAWALPYSSRSRMSWITYHLGGHGSWSWTGRPAGVIRCRHSIGIPYFLKGLDGANPRLAVNWYSRNNFKMFRVYQVVLRGVRNEGVRVVAPRNSNWFATIPVVVRGSGVKPGISLWSSRNGKRLPPHFPPLHHGHTKAFCSSDVLGWVDGGDKIYIAKLGGKPMELTSLKHMVIPHESLRGGAIAPDGKRLLLCARSSKYFPGQVKMIMVRSSGAGTMEEVQYLKTGDITCDPVFSPNSQLAAFALIWVKGRIFGGLDIFLVRVHGFRVLRWAEVHAIMLPQALSFSPDGRQLALTTSRKIFIFDIPDGQRNLSHIALPLSNVKQIRMP